MQQAEKETERICCAVRFSQVAVPSLSEAGLSPLRCGFPSDLFVPSQFDLSILDERVVRKVVIVVMMVARRVDEIVGLGLRLGELQVSGTLYKRDRRTKVHTQTVKPVSTRPFGAWLACRASLCMCAVLRTIDDSD